MWVFDEYAQAYDLWYEKPFGMSAYKLEHGIDTSKELLKMAVRRGIHGVLGRSEALPFKEKAFNKASLLLGLVLSDSPWAEFYKDKAKKGHPIYKNAKFYSYRQLASMLKETGFSIDDVYTTLFEAPQDKQPLRTKEIRKGFWQEGGFFCIRAMKLPF